jgi:cytosine/adenosine deaminase-related metal-dependent hydrolase
MRRISADYIFPVSSEPLPHGVITVDEDGTILNLEPKGAAYDQYYEGIICPGFINTHCHLELSHLRAQLTEKTGMTGFIKELLGKRSAFSDDDIQKAVEEAETEMIRNGIVAVGDISNNDCTFSQKALNRLYYHTFIEIFSMHPDKAKEIFESGRRLSGTASKLNLSNSIVPHAPYTMSEELLRLINENSGSIITIHNQESEGENELFLKHSGPMYEAFTGMGIDPVLMRKTGLNSLQSTLPFLTNAGKILLVHNTCTTAEDIRWLRENEETRHRMKDIYWCTCPNANLFIENKLPDYDLFIREKLNVTIGTDSLASNHGLCILSEMKTIAKHYPKISLQTLLQWATKNGAELLELGRMGTLTKGKCPGLNLLKNVDGMKLTERTEVQKLV